MKIGGIVGALIVIAIVFILWKKGVFDGLIEKITPKQKPPDATIVPSGYAPKPKEVIRAIPGAIKQTTDEHPIQTALMLNPLTAPFEITYQAIKSIF